MTEGQRAALLWVLWHHQGGNSPVGQPIRTVLGMGRFDRLTDEQIAAAKEWDAQQSATQRFADSLPPGVLGTDGGQSDA